MKQQSITSLPLSPDADRHGRMVKYSIMMGIRVVCIIVVLFVPGWWALVPAAGAIFLPYFAVVVANVGSSVPTAEVERPGIILPVHPATEAPPENPAKAEADAPASGEGP